MIYYIYGWLLHFWVIHQDRNDKYTIHHVPTSCPPPGGGGTPLFGLCGYVPLNRVWFSRTWVSNMVYNFTIKRLEQGLFWTGSSSESVKTCDERSTFAIPIIFFLDIYFHDFSLKNYFILYKTKQIRVGK